MNFKEYQAAAKETAIYPRQHAVIYPALGLAGEAGEVAEKVKKWLRDGNIDAGELHKEIGDVLWYCALAARALGLPLEQIAKLNIDKLKARYPGKFDADKAINRNVEGERTILETLSVGTGINHPV